MSAIFGTIYKRDAATKTADSGSMQQALMHRAVDGKGMWQSDQVFIGHHKLVVAPEQGQEQMPYEDGDLVITADAGIHNRDELFTRLCINREQRTTYPDSMLILTAYKKWGAACLDYLEGEFTFAIFNKVAGTLFCATDHIGFRPFYYYDTPDVFVFSSEIKGILAVKKTPDVFNEDALIEYYYGQSDKTRTYNKDVFALCGGNTLQVNNGNVAIKKYWTPQRTGKYRFAKDAEWAECLRDLLFSAVENRMRTDLPVGVTLSGGLDSSSVACIAGRILEKRDKPLYAFSSVLPAGHKGVEVDERKYIELLGRHIGNLEQEYVEAPGKGPFTDLERAFNIEEGIPNAFFYMDHAINEAAQRKHVKVLMSGFGGDFVVSWNGNPVIYQLLRQFNIAEAFKIFAETKRHEKASFYQLLKTEIVAHTDTYTSLVPFLHRNTRNWKRNTTLTSEYFAGHGRDIIFKNDPDHKRFMKKHIGEGYMTRLISTFANRDAAYGMATAMPLFDKNIMDFMFDVPIYLFRKDGTRRSLIRNAMEGILPPEIQWRNDKQPYSPDYVTRLKNDKQFINTLVNAKEYNFAWQYIDKPSITDHIDHVKPEAGMGRVSQVAGVRIIQGVICYEFLKWLMINQYAFKK